MEVRITCKGAVYNLKDNVSAYADTTKESRHNYIVISGNNDRFIQCMSITSMTNKEVTVEVPIVCNNGEVSYINPVNIHSMSTKSFYVSNFKGVISGSMATNDFVNMLIELHAHYMLGGSVDDDCDVIKKYKNYVTKFWNEHKDSKEYRESKGSTVLREKEEEKVVTVKMIPTASKKKEQSSVSNYCFIPKVADIRAVMKRVDDETKWKTQELIYFATGYIKFGYDKMNSYGEGIHIYSSSSMSNKYIRVIEELNKRGLTKEEMDLVYSTTSNSKNKQNDRVSESDYVVAYNMWKSEEVSLDEAMEMVGMNKKTFIQRGYILRKRGILPAVR